ncbi:MAG: hypothetical protein WC346_17360 [Methanogenium sp.]|jgi:hypothetical protein
MAKALSPNGKIFDADVAVAQGILTEDRRDSMVQKYEKMSKTQMDLAMEFINDLCTAQEAYEIGLIDETIFLQTIGIATMDYLKYKMAYK